MNRNNAPTHSPVTTLLRRLGAAFATIALLGISGISVARAQPYYFVNLAGNGAPIDHTDGAGSNARLMNPTGVAVDASGNIFVADGGDHTIRKVTPDGNVSTFAGASGVAGSNDGAYNDARFLYPFAIAVDSAGSVYVTDIGNHDIRKLAGGVVTTLAGTPGVAGRSDGTGTAALFNAPQGIAVAADGTVYVSDTDNSTLRKITPTGVVTTLAGNAGQTGSADGTGGGATFNYPTGLAVDSTGNIYVADFDNSVIRKVTPAGAVSTFVGSAQQTGNADGQGGAARFDHPMGVAVDGAGNIYVMDTSSQTIRLVSPAGVVSTRAGTTGMGGRADGAGAGARFFYASGIAATSAGTVYVADTGNHTIRVMNTSGGVGTLAGSTGQTGSADGTGSSALFAYPAGLALDGGGNVYVADHDNNVIRKIAPGGSVTTFAGAAGLAGSADGVGGAARFNDPTAVAVDGSGNVFVADAGNSTIRKITPGGSVTTFAGQAGAAGSGDGVGAAARFNAPQGVAADSVGNVYVADTNNNTVRKVTSNGTVTTLAGAAGQFGSGDGPGGSARFSAPIAVTVDNSGNVYVADFNNATIRKIAVSTGGVITLAGDAGQPGDIDGSGSLARFNQPYAVAADNNGNIYVTDTYNRVIRKVTASGGVATVTGSAARFYYPQGIAVDSSGNLYVADGDNQAISKGGLVAPPVGGGAVSSQTVAAGQNATFSSGAATAGMNYQWQVSVDGGTTWSSVANNSTYSGATSVTLTATAVTTAMSGNLYRVQLSNSAGSATSGAGTLTVTNSVVLPPPGGGGSGGRISNLSVRTNLGGGQILTVGFVTNGPKSVLVRAAGPALNTVFGLTGFYADPKITVLDNTGTTIAQNDDWNSNLSPLFSALGAFPFTAGSKDAALELSVNGPNTAQINGNGSGVVLVEVYDADGSGVHLTNVSARNQVGTGANILISGFVISGGAETLLIRGIGPALHDVFGITDAMVDPVLEIHQTVNGVDTIVATNDNWDPSLTPSFDTVGAYHFTAGSKDAALLITLQPGVYTAQISGVNGGTGEGVVEVYEMP